MGAKKFAVIKSPTRIKVRLSLKPRSLDGPTRNRKSPISRLEVIRVNCLEILDGI